MGMGCAMNDWMRFGDPSKLQMGLRWVDDPDPPEQRPAEHGWSMGQLTIHVAGVNVTATRLGEEQLPFVGWYLAPFLDWLATHWAVLLHEDRYPWPNASLAPAALACNRALDRWIAADDPQGMQHYADTQEWYFRHGIQSASAGGIFPDLYIRRVADDMELSWSGAPVEFHAGWLGFRERRWPCADSGGRCSGGAVANAGLGHEPSTGVAATVSRPDCGPPHQGRLATRRRGSRVNLCRRYQLSWRRAKTPLLAATS